MASGEISRVQGRASGGRSASTSARLIPHAAVACAILIASLLAACAAPGPEEKAPPGSAGHSGSRNVLYDTFDEASSCGFLDDEISGEMFPGGELEGWVCFQAPADEADLILVVEPFFSFDDGDRRYIALE